MNFIPSMPKKSLCKWSQFLSVDGAVCGCCRSGLGHTHPDSFPAEDWESWHCGSPLSFFCRANAGRQTQYGGCWTAGAGFNPGQHSGSRSGGGSRPPPTGGSVDLLRRAILTNYRTPVYLRDHEPNHCIPYTRSVASDCGGREVTGVPCQSQASYLPHLRAHTHAWASLQKREIGHRLLIFRSDATAPDPYGMWQPYYQGYDPYGLGTGFDPLPGLGFFSMAYAFPAAWLGFCSDE